MKKNIFFSIFKMEINNQLVIAAQNGQFDQVKQLLAQGADPVYNDSDALQWAARNGYYNIVKELINHGAVIGANDNNALKWAKHNNHSKIVRLLEVRSSQPNYLEKEMINSVRDQNLERLKQLISRGVDLGYNNQAALRIAISNNDLPMVKYLLDNGALIKRNVLWGILRKDNPDPNMLQFLLNTNEAKDIALNILVGSDKLNMVKYLLDNGANINNPETKPLYYAVDNLNLPMVKYLISRGANVNIDNGAPLRSAVDFYIPDDIDQNSLEGQREIAKLRNTHQEMVKYLVSQGADVNVLTPEQRREYGV